MASLNLVMSLKFLWCTVPLGQKCLRKITMKQGKRTLTQQDRENILSSFHHFNETDVKKYRQSLLFSLERAGLFTRRKGYPSKWVNLAGGQKIARVYKQNFKGRVTVQPGIT